MIHLMLNMKKSVAEPDTKLEINISTDVHEPKLDTSKHKSANQVNKAKLSLSKTKVLIKE